MDKGFTVYVSSLEMDSADHRSVELPMEQEKLDALQLELNTGSPLYKEADCTEPRVLRHRSMSHQIAGH